MKSLVLIVPFLLLKSFASAQGTVTLSLAQPVIQFNGAVFRIEAVTDERGIAPAQLGFMGTEEHRKILVLLPDVAAAIGALLRPVSSGNNLPAISLHIRKLEVNETSGGNVQQHSGECVYAFDYYRNGNKLGSVGGSTNTRGSGDLAQALGRIVVRALSNTLQQINRDLPKEDESAAIVKGTAVSVTIGKSIKEGREVAYYPGMQLSYSDFQGTPMPNGNNEAAATWSGIALSMEAGTAGGKQQIGITLTPTFNPSKSWMLPDKHSAQLLAHEQGHLDITGTLICRMRDSLQNAGLTLANYAERVQAIHRFFEIEGGRIQEQYDAETNHGIIAGKQEAWTEQIRKDVAGLGCY